MQQETTVLIAVASADQPILAAHLEAEGFAVRVAADGADALAMARREPPDAILAAVLLPGLDGFALCWEAKGDQALRGVPVVLLDDLAGGGRDRAFGEQIGASAVLDRSATPIEIAQTLRAAISGPVSSARAPALDELTFLREERRRFVDALVRQRHQAEHSRYRLRGYAGHLRRANVRLQEAYLATLETLASTLDARDAYTHSHSRAVASYAVAIGRELCLPAEDLDMLHWAGLLHDIGKIGIPDAVLRKAGKPTDAEWRLIKAHPDIGHRLLSPLTFLQGALPAVLHHQERWDGSGYPAGLRGAEIPLLARIVAVADALHAMTSRRPYRLPLAIAQAIEALCAGRGTQFDPTVVDACLRVLERKSTVGPQPPELPAADRLEDIH